MPSRLRSNHQFSLSTGTDEMTHTFLREQPDDEVTDKFDRSTAKLVSVPPSSTVNVGLDGLTNVQFIHMEAPSEVRLAFNGVTEALPLYPRADTHTSPVTLPGRLHMWTNGITAIAITNPGTAAVVVVVVLAGS
jgi:hypothetical protein